MKKIQILGTGCPKCKKLAENAEAAANPTSAVLQKIIFFINIFMSPCTITEQKDTFVFSDQATTTPNSM